MTATRGTETGAGVLRRADGVQLIGEMAGSGYRVPPSLVRRGDGQTLQLTPLLYQVLRAIDGRRSSVEVASEVIAATGKPVTGANIEQLVTEHLRPLGLLTRADGSQPEVKRTNPLLGLRLRYAITDPERTRRLTAPFARLFRPFVVVPLVAAFAVVCWWVFFEKGLASATYEAFQHPGLLLLVFVVTVLSAGFHEFGHAAAARYGGATPGVMGAGVYLVWPAFYTDVTDSYRLGRGGRVRTDLGGLYFNAIVAVAVTGVWWVSGYDALLLVVATQILQMIRQLTPLVRFDGYHVLADVTGVPDLFHRIKPTLVGLLPWRWGEPEARVLKPWARAVVTLWVLLVVPLLLFTLAMIVIAIPRLLGTAWARLQQEQDLLSAAWADADLIQTAARVFAIVAISLPILGIFYLLARLVRQAATSTWRATAHRPVRRTVAGVLAAAMVTGVAWAWWPDGDTYRPVQPDERGTLVDGITTLAAPVGLTRPEPVTDLEVGERGTARAAWDANEPLPTEDEPRLALVMVPQAGQTTASGEKPQAWVFPFDKPLAPGPGDNQAMAVNTTDGTIVYDTAFALVWADGDEAALNTNESYAFASCTRCGAVAVAFQVVLVVGDNDVAVPQNLSGAVNYECVNCLTYALARQLFVTLDQPLSDTAIRELDRLWAEIADYGANIRDVPLEEVAGKLEEYQREILTVIQADQLDESGSPLEPAETPTLEGPSSEPTGSASPSPSSWSSSVSTSTTSPSPSESASSEPSPSSSTSPSPSPSGSTSPSPSPSPSTTGSTSPSPSGTTSSSPTPSPRPSPTPTG